MSARCCDWLWKGVGVGVVLGLPALAGADMILTNQYGLGVKTAQVGPEKWEFSYTIHNNNQQNGANTGLDGFVLQLPREASVEVLAVPTAGSGGYWLANWYPELGELWFWGMYPAAVYPMGSEAEFRFTADHVKVGETSAWLTTFWGTSAPSQEYWTAYGAYYTTYVTRVPGAVGVPEAGTLGLLMLGAVLGLRRGR